MMDARISLILVFYALTAGTVDCEVNTFDGQYTTQKIIQVPLHNFYAIYLDNPTLLKNSDVLSILLTGNVQIRVSSPEEFHAIETELAKMEIVPLILHDDDLQFAVDLQMNSMFGEVMFEITNPGVFNKNNQVEAWAYTLAITYDEVTLDYITQSTEHRDVMALTLKPDPSKPVIVVVAGIYGRDFLSVGVAITVFNKMLLDQNELINQFEWVFICVANPDSYNKAWQEERFSSKTSSIEPGTNCTDPGVDFCRNFPNNWDLSNRLDNKDPCSKTYRGPHAASEPEVKGIVNFMEMLNKWRNITGLVELRGYGQHVAKLYEQTDLDLALAVADAMSGGTMQYTHGPYTTEEQDIAGRCISDWALTQLGISHAFAIKLRDTGVMGYLIDEEVIEDSSEEVLAGLRAIGKMSI